MSNNDYLKSLVNKYRVDEAKAKKAVESIYPIIEKWGNGYINRCFYSGSIAKGTAVSISTDADVFISLRSSITDTLKKVYTSLYNAFNQNGYQPRKQNVSIGIVVNGVKIDLVPGVRQGQYGNDHSLYKSKADTWTKTNVDTHISTVSKSIRLNEIKLIKIWRQLNKLDFPSLFVELLVIEALKNAQYDDLEPNLMKVFRYISDNIKTVRFIDPSNTNNIISDDITITEKTNLKKAADIAINAQLWSQVVY